MRGTHNSKILSEQQQKTFLKIINDDPTNNFSYLVYDRQHLLKQVKNWKDKLP